MRLPQILSVKGWNDSAVLGMMMDHHVAEEEVHRLHLQFLCLLPVEEAVDAVFQQIPVTERRTTVMMIL